jgi:hypothetical protein
LAKNRREGHPMADSNGNSGNGSRWKYGVIVVLAGLAALIGALGLTLWAYWGVDPATTSASAVAAVLAPITTVVGTLVGAYFGIQTGQASTAEAQALTTQAQEQRAEAERVARALAAVAPPQEAKRILGQEEPPQNVTG